MTNKENYLNALTHKPTMWTPVQGTSVCETGFTELPFEKPYGGGVDGFGVRWICEEAAGGDFAPIPAPSDFVLEDVTQWEKLPFPNVDDFDWEAEASRALAGVDRENTVVEFCCGNGQFERLAALMGFENALMALYEEPDAVDDLLAAITDYKIEIVKKVAKYYKADTFTNFDDVATAQRPFMSPATYEDLISPHHKRLNDAVREYGMLPLLHCCGNATPLIESFIDEGNVHWSSVQPVNDIVELSKKYGDKICLGGGYDTSGLPGQTTDEGIIRAEARRCIDDYGDCPNFIFHGFILLPASQHDLMVKLEADMNEEADTYAKKKAGIIQ